MFNSLTKLCQTCLTLLKMFHMLHKKYVQVILEGLYSEFIFCNNAASRAETY